MKKVLLPVIMLMSICTVLFYACQREVGFPPEDLNADKLVTASVQGIITDKDGVPIQNAKVISGDATTFSDINGVFNFTDIELSSRFGYVRVEKDGYFAGSRSMITHQSSSNFIEIELMERSVKGDFTASAGGVVTVENGQTVSFEATSIVNEQTGSAYTGTVNVYASYIDPTDARFSLQMPGDLRGINTQDVETGMLSYGMLAVELQGIGGEKLQLAAGKTATLTMEIPMALRAGAPASIPLWYFDESTGKWMEEGSAVKQGNSYVGTVSHFTTWNVDVPINFANLKGAFKSNEDLPIAYTQVKITDARNNLYGITYTDSAGRFKTWVPKGGTLKLELINKCGDVITARNVGPYDAEADLGVLKMALSNNSLITLNGVVNDCSGNPVQKGHVMVTLEGIRYATDIRNGVFDLLVNRCSTTPAVATMVAVDAVANVQGAPISINVSTAAVDAGTLEACGTSARTYVDIDLAGTTYTIENNDSLAILHSDTITTFNALGTHQSGATIRMNAIIYGSTPGDFDGYLQTLEIGDKSYNWSPLRFKFTSYGEVNDFVTGTFSGVVQRDSTAATETLNGSFRIRRTE